MSPAQARRSIGGDFELDQLRFGEVALLDQLTRGLAGRWTTSGRGALTLVLKNLWANGVRHVHLPAYLCESVLLPVRALGFKFSFYPVDLSLAAQPDPPAGSTVLVIHYFGWLDPVSNSLREQASAKFYLIEDAAQSLLSDWSAPQNDFRYVILSPRKFGPALLGGWCNVTSEQHDEKKSEVGPNRMQGKVGPKETQGDVGPIMWRSLAARLARGAYLREAGGGVEPRVEEFYMEGLRAVEDFLDQHPTCTDLPQLALDQLAGLDWREMASRRRANWRQLQEILTGRVEVLMHDLPDAVVPLGFVVCLGKRDEVRARLAAQRIFCPVHWPLPAAVERARFPAAAALSDTCLTLPIDQRYTQDDISRMAEALLAAL
ncbi:MAG TPA: DegT/DnrJ/EryC1/StrS family aminotransferase [Pyrinomonadaceae bacterium]|jgi:hypothetical protein|nr:DegT/DnrJ/EryC1/StrS family aminotransferase [Pyrinomonadaceae bacterium]